MTSRREEIVEFFRGTLRIEVESDADDLIESGLLDSLALVELLFFLESRFGVIVDVANLDLEQIRTVQAISRLAQGGATCTPEQPA